MSKQFVDVMSRFVNVTMPAAHKNGSTLLLHQILPDLLVYLFVPLLTSVFQRIVN